MPSVCLDPRSASCFCAKSACTFASRIRRSLSLHLTQCRTAAWCHSQINTCMCSFCGSRYTRRTLPTHVKRCRTLHHIWLAGFNSTDSTATRLLLFSLLPRSCTVDCIPNQSYQPSVFREMLIGERTKHI